LERRIIPVPVAGRKLDVAANADITIIVAGMLQIASNGQVKLWWKSGGSINDQYNNDSLSSSTLR